MKNLLTLIVLLLCYSVNVFTQNNALMNLFKPDHPSIRYVGRIDFENSLAPRFISAGAYCTFNFTGTSCSILADYEYGGDGYAFFVIECDGKYLGRTKISKGTEKYEVVAGLADGVHSMKICKATEAITGYIELRGIMCNELTANYPKATHKIEFIGNSITCGAQSDSSDTPCNKGPYQEYHNAYLAYGPHLARALDADWVLSSVSGMGLTRNWNNEGPALPAFYDNLYLNADSTKIWSAKTYCPELVTICLGTNDNSLSDGSYDRKPLDSTTFVNAYIQFVKRIHLRYPDAIICLINSPVFDGELKNLFEGYLKTTVTKVKQETDFQKLYYFSYQQKYEGGCGGHPSTEEQKKMADELLPFIKEITGW